MSFSSDIKEEILSKSKKETKHCCILAEKFGELLTDVALKSELKEEYSEYMDISKLSECCIKSILKGAFLASGYIIDPLNDYHFEIDFKNKACAEYIFNLFIASNCKTDAAMVLDKLAVSQFMFLFILFFTSFSTLTFSNKSKALFAPIKPKNKEICSESLKYII